MLRTHKLQNLLKHAVNICEKQYIKLSIMTPIKTIKNITHEKKYAKVEQGKCTLKYTQVKNAKEPQQNQTKMHNSQVSDHYNLKKKLVPYLYLL